MQVESSDLWFSREDWYHEILVKPTSKPVTKAKQCFSAKTNRKACYAVRGPAHSHPTMTAARPVFSLASGGEWDTRRERQIRQALSELGADVERRGAVTWNPCTTHLVAATPTRSFKWLCAVASAASVRVVMPEYIDACVDAARCPIEEAPYEWSIANATTSQSGTPLNSVRVWLGAAQFWRRRVAEGMGPALHLHRVLIVGELKPRGARGAGVASSAMLMAILEAAGAQIVTTLQQRPTFALVGPNSGLESDPLVKQLLANHVLCVGSAFVIDLIARVSVEPSEYVAFSSQKSLAGSRLDVQSCARFRAPLPLKSKGETLPNPRESISPEPQHPSIEKQPEAIPRPKETRMQEKPSITSLAATRIRSWPEPPNRQGTTADGPQQSGDSNEICLRPQPQAHGSPSKIDLRPVTDMRSSSPPRRMRSKSHLVVTSSFSPSTNGEQPNEGSFPNSSVRHIHAGCTSRVDTALGNATPYLAETEDVETSNASDGKPDLVTGVTSFTHTDPPTMEPDFGLNAAQSQQPGRKRRRMVIRESPPTDDESDADPGGNFVTGLDLKMDSDEENILYTAAYHCGATRTGSCERIDEGMQCVTPVNLSVSSSEPVLVTPCKAVNGVHISRQQQRYRVRLHTPAGVGRRSLNTKTLSESCGSTRMRDAAAVSEASNPEGIVSDMFGGGTSGSDLDAGYMFILNRIGGEAPVEKVQLLLQRNRIHGERAVIRDEERERVARSGLHAYAEHASCTQKVSRRDGDNCMSRGITTEVQDSPQMGVASPVFEPDDGLDEEQDDGHGDLIRIGTVIQGNAPTTLDSQAPFSSRGIYRDSFRGQTRRGNGTAVGEPPPISVPTSMTLLANLLPSQSCSLSSASQMITLTGNCSDDHACEGSLTELDWIYGAESVIGVGGCEGWSTHDPVVRWGFLRQSVRALVDSGVLQKASSVMGLAEDKVHIMLGICMRLLSFDPPDDVLVLFIQELLVVRDTQMETGTESVMSLLTETCSSRVVSLRHHALCILWVSVVTIASPPSLHNCQARFWELFNECVRLRFASDSSGSSGKMKTNKSAGVLVVPPSEELSRVDEWTFHALATLGCLFGYRITPHCLPLPPVVSLEAGSSVKLAANWDVIRSMLGQVCKDGTDGNTAATKDEQYLTDLLRRICTDLADRMWPVDEPLLVAVLDAVNRFCTRHHCACACARLPLFLAQFQSIRDLRARRATLRQHLISYCDCAAYLSWLLIAQAESPTMKLSMKVIRKGTIFAKLPSMALNPVRAMCHQLGLTLSVADSVTSGRANGEELLRGMLFAKAPDLKGAAQNPFSFTPVDSECWAMMLDAIQLRCRALMASSKSIHAYCDYLCKSVMHALQCLERPDEQFGRDVAKREAWRVQNVLFVDLSVRILSAFSEILAVLTAAVQEDKVQEEGSIERLLVSLASFVTGIGRFAAGLVSQIRTSGEQTVSSCRQAMLLGIVSFVEQGLGLCTAQFRQRLRRLDNVLGSVQDEVCGFAVSTHTSMLGALVSIVQCPVLLLDKAADEKLRLVAAAALAQTVALCCTGTQALYSATNSFALLKILRDAGMDCMTTYGCDHTSNVRSQESSIIGRCSIAERLMVRFWCTALDSAWRSDLFLVHARLDDMVFALWMVSLARSDDTILNGDARPLLSDLYWALQSTVSSSDRLRICKWFQMSGFYERMDVPSRLRLFEDSVATIFSSGRMAIAMSVVYTVRSALVDKTDSDMALEIFALLFAVEAAISSSGVHVTGDRGRSRSVGVNMARDSIGKIAVAFTRSLKRHRRHRDNTSANASANMCARIQARVMHGMSCVGYDPRDVETRVCVLRFLNVCSRAPSCAGLFVGVESAEIPTWLREISEPRHRAVERAGIEWRQLAFHTLIEDPVSRQVSSPSLEFTGALQRLLEALDAFSHQKTNCLVLRQQLKPTLARIALSSDGKVHHLCGSISVKLFAMLTTQPASAPRSELLDLATRLKDYGDMS